MQPGTTYHDQERFPWQDGIRPKVQSSPWVPSGSRKSAYNFSIYSEHAERVTLLLFGEDDPAVPLLEHRLDPRVNKTWHI